MQKDKYPHLTCIGLIDQRGLLERIFTQFELLNPSIKSHMLKYGAEAPPDCAAFFVAEKGYIPGKLARIVCEHDAEVSHIYVPRPLQNAQIRVAVRPLTDEQLGKLNFSQQVHSLYGLILKKLPLRVPESMDT